MDPTVEAILKENQGRLPALLALKWAKLARDPLSFFRGTAGLFYADWTKQTLPSSPTVWLCGDAHLENLGSYRGEDRIAYFDLNDFDEALRGPVSWDLGRAWVCLELSGNGDLGWELFQRYASTLVSGKTRHIEKEHARGPVLSLLEAVEGRNRKTFLENRIVDGKLKQREGRTYPISDTIAAPLHTALARWAKSQTSPSEWKVMDICGRIAGTGSLGLERYLVLVAGRHHPRILDLKEATVAAGAAFAGQQPNWKGEAERIATLQEQLQYMPVRRLFSIKTYKAFVMKEAQPYDDKVNFSKLDRSGLEIVVNTWAVVLASAHLRGAGWRGAESVEALRIFGRRSRSLSLAKWQEAVHHVAENQRRHATAFAKAYKAGHLPHSAA